MSAPDTYADPQEALAEIRHLMSRSSRFLSLSGLSGVWAGFCALVAAGFAYAKVGLQPFSGVDYFTAFMRAHPGLAHTYALESYVLTVGIITMLVALAGAVFFTLRRARGAGSNLWVPASRSLLVSLLVPLVAGGLLVLAHWQSGVYGFSAAITLIFYGLSLLAGGRYTHDEIRALGYCEVLLGVLTAFNPAYGLEAWALGFGLLHIVYGLLMWTRHERNA